MPQTIEREDGRVASASSYPTFDCGSLVIEYRGQTAFNPGIRTIGNSPALAAERSAANGSLASVLRMNNE